MDLSVVGVTAGATSQTGSIPVWLGAVGALFVIAAAMGAAVAIYKTTVQSTSLREAEHTMDRLRNEIADGARREQKCEADIRVLEAERDAAKDRITVLEDLITKRQDDAEIRQEIAAVRKVVDENVMAQLTAILSTEEVTATHLATIMERLETLDAQ